MIAGCSGKAKKLKTDKAAKLRSQAQGERTKLISCSIVLDEGHNWKDQLKTVKEEAYGG